MVDYKNSTHRKVMKAMWTKILHAEKGWLKKMLFNTNAPNCPILLCTVGELAGDQIECTIEIG